MTDAGVSPADSGELLSLMLPSLCSTENETDGLGYYGDQNLFRRIIRNPNPYGRMPKERECAEMLCGCLIHMPVFRIVLLNQMAEWLNQSVDFENLRLRFSTEQPVLGKRDDLRVEGFDDEGVQKLLWTIEIKVGSGFHYSSRVEILNENQNVGNDEVSDDSEHVYVNQVENYDKWLTLQEVPLKAGFVLSFWNQKDNMPHELKNSWHCLTWGEIAKALRGFIQVPDTSDNSEIILGKNLLGFIEQSLGGGEMENDLQLEDIAFFKAFAQQGKIAKQKIQNLLYMVYKKLEYSSLFSYEPIFESHIYLNLHRQTFYWSLIDSSNKEPPFLFAGLVSERRSDVAVWIETFPEYPKKKQVRLFLNEKIYALAGRGRSWQMVPTDLSGWWDLELRVPLEVLLGQKDQVVWLHNHFEAAFEDLEAVGIIKGIQEIVANKE